MAKTQDDDLGESLSLLAATRRLAVLNEDVSSHVSHFPGPASLHFSAHFSSLVRPFSDWPRCRQLLEQDPTCTRLLRIRVYIDQAGCLAGIQATYRSSGQLNEMPLRKKQEGTFNRHFSELELQDGERIVRVGTAFDGSSRVIRLVLATNQGHTLTSPPEAANDTPYMHWSEVPRTHDLVAFCGAVRADDIMLGFRTRPRQFWPLYGWLILWHHQLAEREGAARTATAAEIPQAAPVDGAAECLLLRMLPFLLRPDQRSMTLDQLDKSERLLLRLVLSDLDTFRMVVRRLL